MFPLKPIKVNSKTDDLIKVIITIQNENMYLWEKVESSGSESQEKSREGKRKKFKRPIAIYEFVIIVWLGSVQSRDDFLSKYLFLCRMNILSLLLLIC